MANRRIEEHLETMARLRGGTATDAGAVLTRELKDRSNLVVAKAAQLAAELGARELVPDLLAAFERLFDDAVKRDPQCWGKNAIARALRDLDYGEGAPFLRGARWMQHEPVWGGQADTAGTLRGICLLALPACSDVRRETVMRFLVSALAEEDAAVRADAARAIGAMGGNEAALVLRLKALTGDQVAAVTGQVFESLLSVERTEALEFLRGFLRPEGGESAEEAALAIGASRLESGVELLIEVYETAVVEDYRAALLRALGIARREPAVDFLKRIAETGRQRDKAQAKAALDL